MSEDPRRGRCNRIMVGSGTDTYDPICDLPSGHGVCKSTAAIDQHKLDSLPPLPEEVAGTGLLRVLDRWAREHDAAVSIGRHADRGEWLLMSNFGREAEDSPMAGGSLLGADERLDRCIEQALADARINPCKTCGWEETCEEGCHS